MQIAKHKVVTIEYTLTDTQGAVLTRSTDTGPLTYIQGIGSIIPGLENALEGKSSGDRLTVQIPPEEGFGPRQDSLTQVISRDLFKDVAEPHVGMQFEARTNSGKQLLTVVGVEGKDVTIDANHPLAGKTLNFDVTVREVRDATGEEITHGHPHGPDSEH